MCVKYLEWRNTRGKIYKLIDFTYVVVSCYLLHESSLWRHDASSFLHLLMQIYIQHTIDAIILCGDFNARIGNLPDFDKNLDTVPPTLCIDFTQNQHAKSFIKFLNACKFCVLNGRFDNESNKYTYKSTKGNSVVHSVCVPHDAYKECLNFHFFFHPMILLKMLG
jgi:hypothetical protein